MFIVYFDNSFMSEPKPESQKSQDYPRLHSVIQQTYRLYVLDFLADNWHQWTTCTILFHLRSWIFSEIYTPHSCHHVAAVIVLPCSKCFRDGEGSRNLRRPLGLWGSQHLPSKTPHLNQHQQIPRAIAAQQNTSKHHKRVEWLTRSQTSNFQFTLKRRVHLLLKMLPHPASSHCWSDRLHNPWAMIQAADSCGYFEPILENNV